MHPDAPQHKATYFKYDAHRLRMVEGILLDVLFCVNG